MSTGTLWRLARADAPTLRALIAAVFPERCWSFGGALLWDVRTDITDRRENLREIAETTPDAVDLRGDLGHAFAAEAEVRWRRRDDGDYDVLVLAEHPPAAVQAHQLTLIASFPQAITMKGDSALHVATPAERQAQGLRWRLDFIEYRTAQGTAQFARYTQWRDEPLTEEEPR